MVDFEGVKAEKVGTAVSGGHIPYVELVRAPNIEGLDTEGVVVPREQRMKLTINAAPEDALNTVRRINLWARQHEWTDVRVRLDLPDDRSRLVSIAREVDAADVLFVRAVPVELEKPLEACAAVINEELVEKALKMFQEM